jgi:hypothetical protein
VTTELKFGLPASDSEFAESPFAADATGSFAGLNFEFGLGLAVGFEAAVVRSEDRAGGLFDSGYDVVFTGSTGIGVGFSVAGEFGPSGTPLKDLYGPVSRSPQL